MVKRQQLPEDHRQSPVKKWNKTGEMLTTTVGKVYTKKIILVETIECR